MSTRQAVSDLSTLPDDARLWVFASARPLDDAGRAALLERVDAFVARWTAHGAPVVGGYEWRHDRFLLVAADEAATGVSGCSIDSLFRVLKEVERELGIALLDPSPVWYRAADGSVRCATRADFRERVRGGEVGAETPVFDNTVATVGALRSGGWERPMREAWHARAFGVTA